MRSGAIGSVGGAFEKRTPTAEEVMTRLPALNIDRGVPSAKPLIGRTPEWKGLTRDSGPSPLESARFTRSGDRNLGAARTSPLRRAHPTTTRLSQTPALSLPRGSIELIDTFRCAGGWQSVR